MARAAHPLTLLARGAHSTKSVRCHSIRRLKICCAKPDAWVRSENIPSFAHYYSDHSCFDYDEVLLSCHSCPAICCTCFWLLITALVAVVQGKELSFCRGCHCRQPPPPSQHHEALFLQGPLPDPTPKPSRTSCSLKSPPNGKEGLLKDPSCKCPSGRTLHVVSTRQQGRPTPLGLN